jgi:hypothetical protein
MSRTTESVGTAARDPAAARGAYERRRAARTRRAHAETQAMRRERERLSLAHAIRRELFTLAQGAGELARKAAGQGRAATQAKARLAGRRRRAMDALTQADRFALDAGLAEIASADREALELPAE